MNLSLSPRILAAQERDCRGIYHDYTVYHENLPDSQCRYAFLHFKLPKESWFTITCQQTRQESPSALRFSVTRLFWIPRKVYGLDRPAMLGFDQVHRHISPATEKHLGQCLKF